MTKAEYRITAQFQDTGEEPEVKFMSESPDDEDDVITRGRQMRDEEGASWVAIDRKHRGEWKRLAWFDEKTQTIGEKTTGLRKLLRPNSW